MSEIATSEILTVSLTDGLDGPAPITDDPLDPNDPNSDGDPLTARGEGDEDSAIALDLGPISALDPNETFSDVTLSGVPAGAVISAGTDNGDGTWTVPTTQLAGLSITPPANASEDFTLTASVVFNEDGVEQTFSGEVEVVVNAVADPLTVTISVSDGVETVTSDANLAAAPRLAEAETDINGITEILVYASSIKPVGSDNMGYVNGQTVTYDVSFKKPLRLRIQDDDPQLNDTGVDGIQQRLVDAITALNIPGSTVTSSSTVVGDEQHHGRKW